MLKRSFTPSAPIGASGHRLFPMYIWLLCVWYYIMYNIYIYTYLYMCIYILYIIYMRYVYISAFVWCQRRQQLQMPCSTHHGQELSLSPGPNWVMKSYATSTRLFRVILHSVWDTELEPDPSQQQHRSRQIFWAPKHQSLQMESSLSVFPIIAEAIHGTKDLMVAKGCKGSCKICNIL